MIVEQQTIHPGQNRLSRLRSRRRRLRAFALPGGVGLIAVLLGGCDGGSSSSPSVAYQPPPPPLAQTTLDAADPSSVPPAPARQPAALAPTPNSGQQPSAARALPPGGPRPDGGGAAGGGRGGAQNPEQAEPGRPEKFSDWNPDDFRAARLEGDVRLIDAVAYLGEAEKGDPTTAKLLTELLGKPKEEEQPEATTPGQRDPRPAGLRGGGAIRRGQGSGGGLVETILSALAQNASRPAQETLGQLVAGKLETEAAAADVALLALAAIARNSRDVQAFEELLYTALVAPGKLGLAKVDAQEEQVDDEEEQEDALSADELQQEALRLVPFSASAGLRVRLAKHVADASMAQDERAQFLDLLIEPLVDNLDAQIVLYLSDQVDSDVKAELHEAFIGYSSQALDRLLGVSPDSGATPGRLGGRQGGIARRTNRFPAPRTGRAARRPARRSTPRPDRFVPGQRSAGSAAERPATVAEALENDPTVPYQVASRLWNPRVVSEVVAQAGQIEGFEDGLDVLRLAWTVPADEVRVAMRELIREHWQEGTDPLRLSGTFGREMRDPGLLLVVKSAPRREDPAKRLARSSRAATRRSSQQQLGRRSAGQNGRRRELSDDDQAKIQWMEASEEFIRELNERFHAAAQSQGSGADSEAVGAQRRKTPRGVLRHVAWRPAAQDEGAARDETGAQQSAPASGRAADKVAGGLSFPLHKDANVVAEYQVNWPADLENDIEGAQFSPLKLHYVRIEEESHPRRVESYYLRHLKSARERTLDDGRWLDFVERGPEPGWRRSVDVMITSSEGATLGGGLAARQPAQRRYGRGDRESRRRDNNEQLVIEILSIEIHDPVQSAAGR